MSTRSYVSKIVPMSPGAQRRYTSRRPWLTPGGGLAPADRFKQVQTSDLWQQKIVDEKESLSMLVEELAKSDEFDPETRIDNSSFSRLPFETQLEMVRKLAEEVRTAPKRKQEDAKRNLVAQLAVVQATLGRVHGMQ